MKRVIKTFLKGCDWCGATGYVINPYRMETTSSITGVCPVCSGSKTVMVTVTEFEDNEPDKKRFPGRINPVMVNPYDIHSVKKARIKLS